MTVRPNDARSWEGEAPAEPRYEPHPAARQEPRPPDTVPRIAQSHFDDAAVTTARRRGNPRLRCGTTLIEVLVAFSLLATMISVLLPTLVRCGRLRQSLGHERLALDELSNQLELLTRMTPDELSAAVLRLEPSQVVRDSLPNVQLKAVLAEGDGTLQVTLQMTWDAVGRRDHPLELTAWCHSAKEADSVQQPASAHPADHAAADDDEEAMRAGPELRRRWR